MTPDLALTTGRALARAMMNWERINEAILIGITQQRPALIHRPRGHRYGLSDPHGRNQKVLSRCDAGDAMPP